MKQIELEGAKKLLKTKDEEIGKLEKEIEEMREKRAKEKEEEEKKMMGEM